MGWRKRVDVPPTNPLSHPPLPSPLTFFLWSRQHELVSVLRLRNPPLLPASLLFSLPFFFLPLLPFPSYPGHPQRRHHAPLHRTTTAPAFTPAFVCTKDRAPSRARAGIIHLFTTSSPSPRHPSWNVREAADGAPTTCITTRC